MLALLIVGALPIGFGHTIRTGLDWYAVHRDDVGAVIGDIWVAALAAATTVALGHAVWRRDWGRALERLWGALGFWSLTTAVAGGWAIYRSHQWWWSYPWFFGWIGVGFAFFFLAVNAGEAADRKQKRQDRLREREDARRLGAENARLRRERLGTPAGGEDPGGWDRPGGGRGPDGETGMTQRQVQQQTGADGPPPAEP